MMICFVIFFQVMADSVRSVQNRLLCVCVCVWCPLSDDNDINEEE